MLNFESTTESILGINVNSMLAEKIDSINFYYYEKYETCFQKVILIHFTQFFFVSHFLIFNNHTEPVKYVKYEKKIISSLFVI